MCNLIEDGDSRRARLRLPRTHRWWLALRNRLRDPDDGSVARHLVASARGGARIPRRIEQVSLQLPVAATCGGIVQARLTFPTRPAKSRLAKWNAWSLELVPRGGIEPPTREFSDPCAADRSGTGVPRCRAQRRRCFSLTLAARQSGFLGNAAALGHWRRKFTRRPSPTAGSLRSGQPPTGNSIRPRCTGDRCTSTS